VIVALIEGLLAAGPGRLKYKDLRSLHSTSTRLQPDASPRGVTWPFHPNRAGFWAYAPGFDVLGGSPDVAQMGSQLEPNRPLVRLLLGPSGCLKGDFLNFPSIPNSFFYGRPQRAVTSNYAPVSEVTRCRRCLQLIASQRQHRQNGLAWGRNGPRRLRMPCL
jgi:hypothetical protein